MSYLNRYTIESQEAGTLDQADDIITAVKLLKKWRKARTHSYVYIVDTETNWRLQ